MLHIGVTQTRINELEKQLETLKSHVFNTPKEDFARKIRTKYPVHQREIRRSAMETFQVTDKTYEVPVEERPALEAFFSRGGPLLTTLDLDRLPQLSDSSADVHTSLTFGRRTPERLRIRSTPLLILLKHVTGQPIPRNDDTTWDNEVLFPGVTFLRPYKMFVKYENSIRQSLLHLESHLQKKGEAAASEGEKKEKKKSLYDASNPEFLIDDEDLLADARLLMEFFDNDLRPTLDLRQAISDGTATDIEFADLWHLFDFGTIVVNQSDHTRAYRVISSTGGREPLTEIMENEEHRTPALDGFVVDCLGLIFDGSQFVPSLHKFTINKFHGPRPICSLPVFPLVFDQNADALSDQLRERGNRYIQITSPPFSHHFMKGRTLDEPSHDVDAPVIVDMTAALNTNAHWKIPTRVQPKDITKADLRETFLAPKCRHVWRNVEGCCGRDYIFKDHSIDKNDFAVQSQNDSHLLGARQKSELTDDDFLLLPDRVHGFILRNRQWVTMKVTDLTEMQYQDNFDNLMLPERHKTSILALVKTHENSRHGNKASVGAALDLVKGKGTGLILLLHGEPGMSAPTQGILKTNGFKALARLQQPNVSQIARNGHCIRSLAAMSVRQPWKWKKTCLITSHWHTSGVVCFCLTKQMSSSRRGAKRT
jgi:hypothetical protein